MTQSNYFKISTNIRQSIITMLANSGSGHPGGSLGMADIFSIIYNSDLFHLSPDKPLDPNRDRIILSNGHICPVWYATLAHRGYFPIEELTTLRQFDSRLQGHPHKDFKHPSLPGIENTSGPLGQATSLALGLALGLKYQFSLGSLNRLPRVVCILGDGELNEGQCWEAFMASAKFQPENLTFIIDRNNIQIDGFTHQVMPLDSLKDKLASFNLFTIEIDGHNHQSIYSALKHPSTHPTAIIAHTIPGKGVSFMENKFEWHGKPPNQAEADLALKELNHA